jgi:hypothetical protein
MLADCREHKGGGWKPPYIQQLSQQLEERSCGLPIIPPNIRTQLTMGELSGPLGQQVRQHGVFGAHMHVRHHRRKLTSTHPNARKQNRFVPAGIRQGWRRSCSFSFRIPMPLY